MERIAEACFGLALILALLSVARIGLAWGVTRLMHRTLEVGSAPTVLVIAMSVSVVSGIAMWAMMATIHRRMATLPPQLDPEEVWRSVHAREEIRELREQAQEEAEESADHRRFELAAVADRPWWLLELSGAHLLWWISFVVGIGYLGELWELPEWSVHIVAPIAVGGAVMKAYFPGLLWTRSSKEVDRRYVVRYYRWWGRGWLPVVLALLPAGAYWLATLG